jgi:hypothetical protein
MVQIADKYRERHIAIGVLMPTQCLETANGFAAEGKQSRGRFQCIVSIIESDRGCLLMQFSRTGPEMPKKELYMEIGKEDFCQQLSVLCMLVSCSSGRGCQDSCGYISGQGITREKIFLKANVQGDKALPLPVVRSIT